MKQMDRLRDAISVYIYQEGKEYDRLLVSETFYEKLQKEAEEQDIPLDFPGIEVKKNADYDFKLLP